MGLFYGFGLRKYELSEGFGIGFGAGMWEMLISILVMIGITMIFRFFSGLMQFGKLREEVSVPIDTFVSRGIELLNSIPRLLLIITITACNFLTYNGCALVF